MSLSGAVSSWPDVVERTSRAQLVSVFFIVCVLPGLGSGKQGCPGSGSSTTEANFKMFQMFNDKPQRLTTTPQNLPFIHRMVAEEFFSAVSGPPLSSNTAIAKDVGIYNHSIWPSFAPKATFRKSAAPPHCLAVSDTHIFAAQTDKAYVHVYSRLRGNQEAFVAFPEKIRCVALAGDVLVVGTAEGRIMLWEASAPFISFPFPQLAKVLKRRAREGLFHSRHVTCRQCRVLQLHRTTFLQAQTTPTSTSGASPSCWNSTAPKSVSL